MLSSPPLGAIEALVLTRLALYPETTATNLSEIFEISKSKVARLVAKLEELGYIDSALSEADRRSKALSFTPAGKSFLSENDSLNSEVALRGCAALTGPEYLELVNCFDRLATGFGAPPEELRLGEPPLEPHRRRMIIVQKILSKNYLDAAVDLNSFHILLEIERTMTGVSSFGELRELLPMHPSKLSRAIDSLARKGIVKKYAPEHDRRLLSVCFSNSGKEQFARWRRAIADRFHAATKGFTEQDLERFIELIATVANSPMPKNTRPQIVIRHTKDERRLQEARAFLVEQLVRERRHLHLGTSILAKENFCSLLEVDNEIQGVAEIEMADDSAQQGDEHPEGNQHGTVRHFALSRSLRSGDSAQLAVQKSVELFFKENRCETLSFPADIMSESVFNKLQTSRRGGMVVVHR